jgi:phage tail P2-like protein
MPASAYPHLLPPNATALERAIAGPLGRFNDLSVLPVPLDQLYRWDTCPTAFLPWLAWANSVDIWDEAWPEETKRNLIRESFELHRRKGSIYAISRYIAYAGGTLRRAITPPDRCYAGASMSQAERAAWLDRFPQIRIYNFRSGSNWSYGAFVSKGAYRLPKTFLGATAFAYQTDAWARYGRRAFLWDKGSHHLASGQEVALRWAERTRVDEHGVATTFEQVFIPGTAVKGLFLGSASAAGNVAGKRFPVESAANTRVVSLAIQMPYAAASDRLTRHTSVGPGLKPVSVFPRKVAERGTRRGGQVFAGMTRRERWLDRETGQRHVIRGFVHGHLPPTTAGDRLYDRIDLHDPARLPHKHGASTFLGHTRLGMPAYHMQLDVEIRGQRTPKQADRFVAGYLVKSDQKRLRDVCAAIVRAKSARDKVLLRTALHRPPNSTDGYTTASGLDSDSLVLAL